MKPGNRTVTVNGRSYKLRSRPIVAVCLDGGDRAYLNEAADFMPHLGRILKLGSEGLVRTVIPSFTNPNNMSIITGVTPDVHGICGNYYYDATANREVPMNDPKDLRAPTILAAFGQAGQAVAAITVKDKLRRLLGKDLRGICPVLYLAMESAQKAMAAHPISRIFFWWRRGGHLRGGGLTPSEPRHPAPEAR